MLMKMVYFAVVAQKEEEDLQRWKETNRAAPVHLNPEKLGKTPHSYTIKIQIICCLYEIILPLLLSCTCLFPDMVCSVVAIALKAVM